MQIAEVLPCRRLWRHVIQHAPADYRRNIWQIPSRRFHVGPIPDFSDCRLREGCATFHPLPQPARQHINAGGTWAVADLDFDAVEGPVADKLKN